MIESIDLTSLFIKRSLYLKVLREPSIAAVLEVEWADHGYITRLGIFFVEALLSRDLLDGPLADQCKTLIFFKLSCSWVTRKNWTCHLCRGSTSLCSCLTFHLRQGDYRCETHSPYFLATQYSCS